MLTISSFADYHKILQELSNSLIQLRDFCAELQLSKSQAVVNDLLQRVKEESFTVAIVGEFKRGKSTFINALLGEEILPADVMPCSATLNRIKYGQNPAVTLFFKDNRQQAIPIHELTQYVTKLTEHSEIMAASIQEAVVYYPSAYCKNNVELIDTPGLNDDYNMTSVTLSVLPRVDVAVMVILAQSPLSQYERDFLENKLLTNDLGRILFVVTGIDRVNRTEDIEKVLNSVTNRIEHYVIQRAKEQFGENSEEYTTYLRKIGKPKVFGLSAYQALVAKQTQNPQLLQESRFPPFELTLEKFLTQERGIILLQVLINRILATAPEIFKAISLQENALAMRQEQFLQAYEQAMVAISVIQSKKTDEIQKIDDAAKQTKVQIQPILNQLDIELKQAVTTAIAEEQIYPADLKDVKSLNDKLGRKVSNAMRKASEKIANRIQNEIEGKLSQELTRIKDFVDSISHEMQRIETTFIPNDIDVNFLAQHQKTQVGEGISIALSAFTGFGGIWSGYRIAGAKGAAVGALASAGTAVSAGVIAGVVGLPITLPLVIATGIISIFTGGWFANKIFGSKTPNLLEIGENHVREFKSAYEVNALTELNKQLVSQNFEQKVNEYIASSFADLKQKVQQEIDISVENLQATLDQLKEKRERDEVLTEKEYQELLIIREETRKIVCSSQEYLKTFAT